ncbi:MULTISPECIES: DUF4440 domain-containing protein [unclassified Microbulbifer]|uniref:DUF4440 domain-containing protein n=1 Tax=Microbulbifer spongiae TaxID=2944933 RepID=A0ABY9E7X4_9GAMM|nr:MULTISPECIES: DUF4440 domain-containing protein [unclassified Microbulbifer]MDP5208332.1 DUF4440 domain-containing protein [Microbulbifer sp. 2205BS26-8]WKD48431.1 DUF4440 domain-containing protein [Microbulbifer sp. MI-G]
MDILIDLERALHQCEVRQNKAKAASLIHTSFKEIGASGRSYDFDSIVEMMSAELSSNGYIHSQDFESIQLEASVYLLLYKSAWVDNNGIKSNFAKRSSIWIFSGEKWQLKYHQGTPCLEFELGI